MSDNIGTHWDGCWQDGGHRHYACAVAEAEYQRTRAEMAEAELLSTLQLVDRYGAWMGKTSKPVPFAEWVRRLQGLVDLIENTEVQP